MGETAQFRPSFLLGPLLCWPWGGPSGRAEGPGLGPRAETQSRRPFVSNSRQTGWEPGESFGGVFLLENLKRLQGQGWVKHCSSYIKASNGGSRETWKKLLQFWNTLKSQTPTSGWVLFGECLYKWYLTRVLTALNRTWRRSPEGSRPCAGPNIKLAKDSSYPKEYKKWI